MTKVLVSGGFDPLHPGHIVHIEEAASLGDYIIVVMARDDQLIAKKGKFAQTYWQRFFILDWGLRGLGKPYKIVPNIDKTIRSENSLRFYKPDIFAKGGDRTPDNMPKEELSVCTELGISIKYGIGEQIDRSSEIMRNM